MKILGLPKHRVQKLYVILSLMLTVVPAFTQSPARARAQNHRVTRATKLGVDVTVVDPTNAVIRKANVTLSLGKDTVTLETRGTSTDARGVARFRSLSKGSYEIIVQTPGFSTVQETVTVKKTEHLRVKLQIAVKPETVEVRAAPAVVDTIVDVTVGPLPYVPYRELPPDLIRLAVV